MTVYEEARKRAESIKAWLPAFIKEQFAKRLDGKKNTIDMDHLYQHMNQTEKQLIHRIVKEGVLAATTFIGDEVEIITMVKDTLLHEEVIDEISDYLSIDDDEDYVLRQRIPKEIKAFGFSKGMNHEWSEGSIACSEYVIVISQMKNYNGFIVKTVYPVLN